jgi:hypothetical protein
MRNSKGFERNILDKCEAYFRRNLLLLCRNTCKYTI